MWPQGGAGVKSPAPCLASLTRPPGGVEVHALRLPLLGRWGQGHCFSVCLLDTPFIASQFSVSLGCSFPGPVTGKIRLLLGLFWGLRPLPFSGFWFLQCSVWYMCGPKETQGSENHVIWWVWSPGSLTGLLGPLLVSFLSPFRSLLGLFHP